jgi:hypothetical protein
MFLHVVVVVGHNHRFRVIHNTFRRFMKTVSRYFKKVLPSMGELRGDIIKLLIGHTPPKIKKN